MVEMELSQVIGKRVKLARQMRGLSQKQLAEKVGLTTQGLSQIETARKPPSWRTVADIADATGLDVFWFAWPYEEDPKTLEVAGRLNRAVRLRSENSPLTGAEPAPLALAS